jgi:hypothetical protein
LLHHATTNQHTHTDANKHHHTTLLTHTLSHTCTHDATTPTTHSPDGSLYCFIPLCTSHHRFRPIVHTVCWLFHYLVTYISPSLV